MQFPYLSTAPNLSFHLPLAAWRLWSISLFKHIWIDAELHEFVALFGTSPTKWHSGNSAKHLNKYICSAHRHHLLMWCVTWLVNCDITLFSHSTRLDKLLAPIGIQSFGRIKFATHVNATPNALHKMWNRWMAKLCKKNESNVEIERIFNMQKYVGQTE